MNRAWLLPLVLLSACSSAEVPPQPLRYTIDDFHLAAVPVTEKQSVIDAKQEYDVAQMEHAKAMTDRDDVNLKISVAANEIQKAQLDASSARQKKAEAAKGSDMNRRNNAEKELQIAELGTKAADLKMAYLRTQRGHIDMILRYTLRNSYAKEARYQLAKANVAKEKNISPPGFDQKNFEVQAKQRSEEAQLAKVKADRVLVDAEKKKAEWEKADRAYQAAKGVTPPSEPPPSEVTPDSVRKVDEPLPPTPTTAPASAPAPIQ